MSDKHEEKKPVGFRTATRGKTVAVEIGLEHTKYYIHKALLTHHSEYFAKALRGPWKEAEEQTVRLEDVDCETFDIFVDWLYTGKLPEEDSDWIAKFEPDLEWQIQYWLQRVKVCVFGDRFQARDFQHAVQTNLVDLTMTSSTPFYYSAINYAFEHLPSNNPILRLLVDTQCCFWTSKSDTKHEGELGLRDQLSHSFLVRVMVRFSEIRDDPKVKLIRCNYHEHVSEEDKERCKQSSPEADSDSESEGNGEIESDGD
ncbi:Nn.00g065680.m01.CDS01 [Neocucurbitaria sp. VM-36]